MVKCLDNYWRVVGMSLQLKDKEIGYVETNIEKQQGSIEFFKNEYHSFKIFSSARYKPINFHQLHKG